jgi:KaiC/GvpD/RAD55 family RecA-like ATPase
LTDVRTEWTAEQKAAGVGVAALLVVAATVALRGVGRCGRLRRYHDYARRMGGAKDNEAVRTRIEASTRGCGWAEEIEASLEQDRYLRSKGIG